MEGLITNLSEPHTWAGEHVQDTIAFYAGNATAAEMLGAVQAHGVAAVQAVAQAVTDHVTQAQADGQAGQEILTTLQQEPFREALATPLAPKQIEAVADMVLLPKRVVTRASLLATIHDQAQSGDISDQTLAQALGSPTHFGGETGNMRALLSQFQQLQLASDTLSTLQQQTQREAWAEMQQTLQQQGMQAAEATQFIQNLTAIPRVLQIPQTTAQRSDS
jgi:hypothetical protein